MSTKVYVIDDDDISLFLTESMLVMEGIGKEVVALKHAPSALQTILTDLNKPGNLPGIIFLDLNMPVMSGWELLEALHAYQSQLLHTCYFYILSSAVDETERLRASHYSLVSGYLQKPLTELDVARIKSELGYE